MLSENGVELEEAKSPGRGRYLCCPFRMQRIRTKRVVEWEFERSKERGRNSR